VSALADDDRRKDAPIEALLDRQSFATSLARQSRNQRYAWTLAAITSTNPQIAPTNGRVSSVSAMIDAAAAPTIKTHLNTASSEIFISPILHK
jgi:hypothetical protein